MSAPNRLVPLDGLRGVAILLVLIYHVWVEVSGTARLTGNLFPFSLIYAGNTGVTLFFLLSGFLVSRPFFLAKKKGQTPPLRNYLIQRALRILPPYYAVGVFGVLYTGQLDQWLPTVFFIARGYDLGSFSAVWWSLITEVQFYLLLPLIFLLVTKINYRWSVPVLAALWTTLYLAVVSKIPYATSLVDFQLQYRLILSVVGQSPAFLVGMLLAYLSPPKGRSLPPSSSSAYLGALLLLLSLVLLPAASAGAKAYIWQSPWYVLPEAALWGAIMWVMLRREPPRFSLLDNRMTRHFGRISFSLYLVHMPVLQAVEHHSGLSLWGAGALSLLLSIAMAHVLYLLIEKPSLALKNKLFPTPTAQGIKK